MSRPRVFVSSTYYDLKHVRSSLENFIEQLGYEPILSEKGDIAYAPDIALDESCYREVQNSDIFVLILGGRYGSEKTTNRGKVPKEFYDRYDSITRQEYKNAVERDIPIYILIEKAVYADFETYLRNKDNSGIKYAHVDSVNIFQMIEEILSQPRNNALHHFDRYADIEFWLREQWAGLFKELLSRMSSQQQLSSLSSHVRELSEMNKTLKTYLEQVVSKIAPAESARIIKAESKRLDTALSFLIVERNPLTMHLTKHGIDLESVHKAIVETDNFDAFIKHLKSSHPDALVLNELLERYRKPAENDYQQMKAEASQPELALRPRRRVVKKATPTNSVSKSAAPEKKKEGES